MNPFEGKILAINILSQNRLNIFKIMKFDLNFICFRVLRVLRSPIYHMNTKFGDNRA